MNPNIEHRTSHAENPVPCIASFWKTSFRMHWVHEPLSSFDAANPRRKILPLQAGEGRGEGESCGRGRFMESFNGSRIRHTDHEPFWFFRSMLGVQCSMFQVW